MTCILRTGGVAGALSIAVTQPLDTIRVNLQQQHSQPIKPAVIGGGVPVPSSAQGGIIREFGSLVEKGGVKALYVIHMAHHP